MAQFWPPTPIKILAGTVSVPILAAGAVSSALSITFASSFAAAPLLVATANNVRLTVEVSGSTATGATVKAANWSPLATAAAAVINWVAFEV